MTIPSVYGLSLKLNLDRYVHKILHEMAQFMYFVVLFFLLLVFEAQFVILTSKTDAPLIVNAIVMLRWNLFGFFTRFQAVSLLSEQVVFEDQFPPRVGIRFLIWTKSESERIYQNE